jgi:hypothetical protein
MPRDLEHREQVMLFKWVDATKVKIPGLGMLFAIPNFSGRMGKSTAMHGARLKAEGRRKGVPDMFLPVGKEGYYGLFIELKAGNGRATPEQKAWMLSLGDHGYRVELCVGWKSARDVIVDYLAKGDGP